MTQASNLGKGGTNFNASGQLSLTTGVTGTLPVANGGTGTTSSTFVNLATNVTGTLPVANGGTGATTQAGAAANVLPSQTSNSGKYLTTDGTNTSWGTVTSNPGTVTSVGVTAGTGISVSGSPITSSGSITVTNSGVTSIVAGTGISISGGTGAVTVTNTSSVNTNQLVKAWVRFDGRANPVTVQASYNISSVTYVDSSTYTLNFTTAMPSTAYAAAGMGEWRNGVSNGNAICMDRNYPPTTGSLTVTDVGIGGNTNLYYYINVAVFSA